MGRLAVTNHGLKVLEGRVLKNLQVHTLSLSLHTAQLTTTSGSTGGMVKEVPQLRRPVLPGTSAFHHYSTRPR
jgi:hypothetical protein